MKVDISPRKKNSHRDLDGKRCPSFLSWLRGRNCILADTGKCDGKIVAAHVDYAGGKGIGTKVADRYAVPMCGGPRGHHAEQHSEGWASFEEHHKLNALARANDFWQAWPGRRAWEASR